MKRLEYKTIVVGSGCAGLNALDTLSQLGESDVALVTEGLYKGTSRNTGSDKQTYYKLSISGRNRDSVEDMARTLSACGEVDGEVSYCEAANSVRSFLKLAELGVEFPKNKYGEYVGYQTDHDEGCRATSAGPLTSYQMWERLLESIERKNLCILDGYTAVRIVKDSNRVSGVICIKNNEPVFIKAKYVILATGGPSAIYKNSVYPESQRGMSSMAINAGARAVNLQHFQYGIASTEFRWNLSGTYQQVIPRYVSIDSDGFEREFLLDSGLSKSDIYSRVFLKGYQWPFDSRKIDGSSYIDILIHEELSKNRKVFLDYRSDPEGFNFDILSDEAHAYLKNSNALLKTPYQRLKKMNPLAIKLYRNHNIDLRSQMLEINVCAQNHNGGILVDCNWESDIKNLYVVGEASGTFGAYRPGGSALNSTQVGSLRAAESICLREREDSDEISNVDESALDDFDDLILNISKRDAPFDIKRTVESFESRMSDGAAFLRDLDEMRSLSSDICDCLDDYFDLASLDSCKMLSDIFCYYDTLCSMKYVLSAMIFAGENIGSYGGAITLKDRDVITMRNFNPNRRIVSEIGSSRFEDIKHFDKEDDWFETVWAEYREKLK
ncbi:MAG: FAD-binding protein [Sphaerochaeta sp.]